jgi:hypothetical protein
VRFLGSTVRLTAVTIVVAAVGLVLPASPASAATCSSAHGVSVVVDFHELGGGVQTACVAGGGGDRAADLFPAAGQPLTRVQRQQGFVCRVAGKPSSDPCVNTPPANAYWGLWWSDGKSGSWTYASSGVDSLTIPDGGYVALSWNGSSGRSAPGVSPSTHAAPTPTSKPTTKPTSKPTSKPSTKPTPKPSKQPSAAGSTPTSASASSTPSSTESSVPSESPAKQPSGKAGQPTKSPGGVDSEMLSESTAPSTTESTDAAPASSDPADPADDGLPTWVGPVVVAVLFAAGSAVAVVRRRRNPAP